MFHLTTLSLSPSLNSDDDIASTIHVLGSSFPSTSSTFVAILAPDGTYAEYAVAPASTTFKVPERVLFEGLFSFLFRDV